VFHHGGGIVVKRRTLLAGLAGGSVVLVAGLSYQRWSTRDVIRHQPLTAFDSTSDYDACIVGTGPAGCTLAERLSDAGYRVLLVESGTALTDGQGMQKAFTLDVYSNSGPLDYPLQGSRMRVFGGTSNIWTGRCPRMLPSDFADNPLAPGGTWPISYLELQPFYRQAEKTLHVVGDRLTASHAPRDSDLPGQAPQDISRMRAVIEPAGVAVDYPPVSNMRHLFEDAGPVRFIRDSLPALSRRNNVHVVSDATATRVLTGGEGVVTGIQVQSVQGARKVLTAKRYVIAGGAVESTRLLLLSQSDRFPAGIGNHADHLGRYFMEHPFVGYSARMPGMEPFDRWQLGRTYQYCDLLKKEGQGGILLGFYGSPKEPDSLRIELGIEMAPSADNRIRLNPDRLDPFGNPGADLNLAFSSRDQQLLMRGEEIVHDIFKRLGGVDVTKKDSLHWSHHHMGTTRMSKAAGDGVVDADLRVHGTENLHVLSSSVFVTAGVANPTLTITALAHRLSGHLMSLL